ncbi:hypothetical protein FQN49_001853 [Arthroderma sp. PD_2]|nr:hypothetical protein FQN49_001853 [Arthroderma sp. PD_2]
MTTIPAFWADRFVLFGFPLSTLSLVYIIVAPIVAQRVLAFVYGRYLHPLAQFPGPAAAASSTRWLYKVSMTGHAEEAFEVLHERYKIKALRIAPNELHISDVHQYNIIYAHSEVFPIYTRFYDAFDIPFSVGGEADIGLHKERRQLMSPFYSRGSLFNAEGVMHERAVALVNKIHNITKIQPSIDIIKAITCHVLDVTITSAFAYPSNLIEKEEGSFAPSLIRAFDGLDGIFWKYLEWPIFMRWVSAIPKQLYPVKPANDAKSEEIANAAKKYVNHYENHGNPFSHPVLLDHISAVPKEQKLSYAIELLFSSADTISSSLTTGIINILLNPDIEKKLVDSLDQAKVNEDGNLDLVDLEKISYLVACVKESVRVGNSIPGRLPRIVPNLSQPLVVDEKVIPAGTVVSISAYTMNFSQELWGSDAKTFNPDRWLKSNKKLRQELYSFSKGSRMCPGQNLTYGEMTILMGYLFKNFKLSLPPNFRMPEVKDWFPAKYPPSGVHIKFESV